ncbi:MAG: FxsA family protein [Rhodobacterales bacterium]|nr:FxsA family protein [Rhodobacterales bacterium]
MWIVLGILALPLVEIGLFVTLGAKLGLWLTLAWVILTGVLGVLLLRGLALGGRETLRRGLQEGLHDPLSPLANRALMAMAAVLLILPGFFTDTLGLLLLLPPVRGLIVNVLARRMPNVTVIHRGSGFEDEPYEHRNSHDRLN